MFPSKLIDTHRFTRAGLTFAVGAVGESTLETADVTVKVEGLSSELRVLVQPDSESALLGTDFPPSPQILHKKLEDVLVQESDRQSAQDSNDSISRDSKQPMVQTLQFQLRCQQT